MKESLAGNERGKNIFNGYVSLNGDGSGPHRVKKAKSSLNRFGSSWNDRIGLPISTCNEKVFPKYKILFEHL